MKSDRLPPRPGRGPPVGRTPPVSRLINVVLPAPFGPIKACRAPFSIRNETSLLATKPVKRFVRPIVSSTTGIVSALRSAGGNLRRYANQDAPLRGGSAQSSWSYARARPAQVPRERGRLRTGRY